MTHLTFRYPTPSIYAEEQTINPTLTGLNWEWFGLSLSMHSLTFQGSSHGGWFAVDQRTWCRRSVCPFVIFERFIYDSACVGQTESGILFIKLIIIKSEGTRHDCQQSSTYFTYPPCPYLQRQLLSLSSTSWFDISEGNVNGLVFT